MKTRQGNLETIVNMARAGRVKYVGVTKDLQARLQDHQNRYPRGTAIVTQVRDMRVAENRVLQAAQAGSLDNEQITSNAPNARGYLYAFEKRKRR